MSYRRNSYLLPLGAVLALNVSLASAQSDAITLQSENHARMQGVQTEGTSDTGGGRNVGWIDTGDWLVHDAVNIPTAGDYVIEYRVASPNTGGRLSVDVTAGATVLGHVDVPNTGGWQNWTTASHTVTLAAGTYNFGLYAQRGGWNINWMRITPVRAVNTGVDNGLYRIRNAWQTNQYLYESSGVVTYGTPGASDKSSQWAVVSAGAGQALWNAATGNRMTIAGINGASDPVRTSYADAGAADQWTLSAASIGGNKLVQSVAQPSWYLNVEGLKGYAQSNVIPATWISPQWIFEWVGAVPARPGQGDTTETVGAAMPYTTYEAEDRTLVSTNGTGIGSSRTWGQLSSEASGRQAVQLNAGQSLQFALKSAAQGLTLRYSIPDSANGSPYEAGISLYINGRYKQQLMLTNKYSWIYGVWDSEGATTRRWTNNPNAQPRNAHKFFDEVSVLLDQSYPAGTTFQLVRETGNVNAGIAAVVVDLVETEPVPAAGTQPADHVAITAHGARPDDGADDTAAMNAAMAEVRNSGGSKKGVWLPAGRFDFNNGRVGSAWDGSGTRIYLDNGVSLKGAGMWRTVLQGAFAGLYAKGGNITISDLKISASDVLRDDSAGVSGIEGNLSNSTVERVWIQHNKVGLWVTRSFSQSDTVRNARISNVRVRDVWADGINFHFGTSQSVVTQSSIRNTGDDGLAMWSDTYMNSGNVFQNNTVQVPGLANGIAIYGGSDNRVLNNLVTDTVDNGAGIAFGTDFNPPALSGTLTIANNRLDRCGSYHHDWGFGIGAIWAYWHNASGKIQNLRVSVSNNQINDSSYAGIMVQEPSPGANVTFDRNVINRPGTHGVEVRSNAAGAATFTQTTVNGARTGNLLNSAGSNFQVQGSGNPW